MVFRKTGARLPEGPNRRGMADMEANGAQADLPVAEQKNAQCCYAASNKYWTVDPQGIAWEAFHSLTTIPTFGQDTSIPIKTESSCAT